MYATYASFVEIGFATPHNTRNELSGESAKGVPISIEFDNVSLIDTFTVD